MIHLIGSDGLRMTACKTPCRDQYEQAMFSSLKKSSTAIFNLFNSWHTYSNY